MRCGSASGGTCENVCSAVQHRSVTVSGRLKFPILIRVKFRIIHSSLSPLQSNPSHLGMCLSASWPGWFFDPCWWSEKRHGWAPLACNSCSHVISVLSQLGHHNQGCLVCSCEGALGAWGAVLHSGRAAAKAPAASSESFCAYSNTEIALELQIFIRLPKKTHVPSGLKGSRTTYLGWGNPEMCAWEIRLLYTEHLVSKRRSGQDFSLHVTGDLNFSHFLLCLPHPDQTKP